MTNQQHPALFDWATELSDAQGRVTMSEQEAHEIGARLRRLQAGYDAARLEIESLQARIKTMAEEHADELMVAHMAGRSQAAPQTSPAAQGDALDAADIRHGYTAKRDGSILNPDGQPLIPYQSGKGYLRVSLWRDGKRADEYVHRLIAAAFCTRLSDEQTQVNHRDGDRLNNRASNLEWCSPQENSIHAARVLFAQETRAVIGTSLTDGSTVQFQSLSEAEDHGFKRANIQKVIDGKRRSHGGFTWVDAAQEGKKL